MAISGGAVLPPMMGIVSTQFGVKASFLLLVLAMVYIVGASIFTVKK
jgi:fucose permease